LLKQVVQLNKLGVKVILVHGGGPEISSLMEKLDVKPNFIEGLRVTDEATLNIAKMALIGKINKDIVTTISTLGGIAIGLSGIDGNLLLCSKKYIKKTENGIVNMIDGGFIGEVANVNTGLLDMLLSNSIIPVIAPIGIGSSGENFNINGDDAASAIASAMGAHVFALVSDVDGVYLDINDKSTRIKKLSTSEAEELVEKGVVKGGMIPKIKCSINAVKKGVKSVFVISGLVEDNLVKNIVNNEMTGTIIEA
jgi:acetylglutamate kinase